MFSRHVALVSETSEIHIDDLTTVAASVQKQVIRDFAPIWGISATVAAFGKLEDVPVDYWPVIIKDKLDRPEAAGYHEDDLGQPCALVVLTDDWSVTVSHETLEMLADPWGRHLVASQSPRLDGRRVKFLIEVCDPCSGTSYKVNGIRVSDFYTPNFFDPVEAPGTRYSYTGAIAKPREVLKGGYITWYDWEEDQWWHRAWFSGHQPKDEKIPIPKLVPGANIRAAIDRHLAPKREKARGELSIRQSSDYHADLGPASSSRADRLRKTLGL